MRAFVFAAGVATATAIKAKLQTRAKNECDDPLDCMFWSADDIIVKV